MFVDQGSGKSKKPTVDKCTLCNDPSPTRHTTLGASFCETCWDVMASGDEETLGKRIVWD